MSMSYRTLFNSREIKYYHFYGRFSTRIHQDSLWLSLSSIVEKVCEQEFAMIGAFVLMNNHFHGILRIDSKCRFQWIVAFEQHCREQFAEMENDFQFDEGIHLIQINNYKILKDTIRYIYKNPVQAGICQRAIDYPYSTFRQILLPHENADLKPITPIEDPLCLILNPFQIER